METLINYVESSQLLYLQDQQKSILFVDNDLASYFLVCELLSEVNIKVIHSRCGMQAITVVKETPSICMVLTELLLPTIDGFSVLKEIKKLYPQIPVIAQTATVINNMKHTCMAAGFDEYIEKPIHMEDFTNKIVWFINEPQYICFKR